MNCLEAESNICDYLDGALAPAGQAAMELHLSECPRCAALAEDARAAVAFMGRAAGVEPPPELIARILSIAPGRSPARLSTRDGGLLAGFLHAMLAPRLAMGMAMTILSLSMLVKFASSSPQLTPSDLSPSRIWAGLEDRAYAAWTRTLKVYDNLRFVYEVETTIRQWQQEQDDEQKADPNRKPDERKQPAAPAGQAPLSVIVGGRRTPTPTSAHDFRSIVAYYAWLPCWADPLVRGRPPGRPTRARPPVIAPAYRLGTLESEADFHETARPTEPTGGSPADQGVRPT